MLYIAQLVEHRTGISEVTGSNPVEALIFFRLLLSNCLNWKIYCDDHSSLTSLFLSYLRVARKVERRAHAREKEGKKNTDMLKATTVEQHPLIKYWKLK